MSPPVPTMGPVSSTTAPRPGSNPATPDGVRAFIVTPFHRLARTHAAPAMADAMVAAALADSLFFSLPADSARAPVVRYLVITMLPFAVIAPLVGPLIDRLKGGHRFVLVGSAVARAVLCYLMIDQIRAGGAPFFLLALCVLVAQRAYNVARSALVPTVVTSDDEPFAEQEPDRELGVVAGRAHRHRDADGLLLGALRADFERFLAREVVRDEPGQAAVLDRLLDLLLVSVLRTALSDTVAGPGDASVRTALRAMEEHPERAWTVQSLAQAAGLSRAAFARRFAEQVGEPPLAHLTRWRLALAADLLGGTELTLAAIATRVGYSDAFALSTAFKRRYGVPPSRYRAVAS